MTDPMMTRFLMSLDDAVDLVLHAFKHGKQGDIWVHKAPASTIQDLSTALMDIFDKKVDVMVIGTRHGEKLHETLVTREEMARAEDLGKILESARKRINYNKYLAFKRNQDIPHGQFNSYTTQGLR